jgi:hypothetical protein
MYFERHLAELDPERPHRFDLQARSVTTDVTSLAARAPELAGMRLHVIGELASAPTLRIASRLIEGFQQFRQDLRICPVVVFDGRFWGCRRSPGP